MDKKIADFGRFFREKSDFGGAGKDIGMEKSEKKKKNRRKIADFSDKNRFFPEKNRFLPIKTDFSWKIFFFLIFFLTPKICKKLLLTGFEPTQNALKWHPPTTKPLIALIIYNVNFFYILLLFICS